MFRAHVLIIMCSKHVEAWNILTVKQKNLCIKLVNYWDKHTSNIFLYYEKHALSLSLSISISIYLGYMPNTFSLFDTHIYIIYKTSTETVNEKKSLLIQ